MVNNFRILHLGSDSKYDGQFMLSVHYLFEKAFPNQNTFYLFDTHTQKYDYEKVFFINKNYCIETFQQLLSDMDNYDIIVLHNLDFFKSKLVISYKNPEKFIWFPWGSEFYNNPFFYKKKLTGKNSQKLFKKSTLVRLKKYIVNARNKYFNLSNNSHYSIKKATSLIKNLGILHEEDFQLMMNKKVIKKDCKYLKFTYYPLEFIFNEKYNNNVNGSNILVGNSATITNNHIEAINILDKFNLNGKKVITPLSYGDSKYAKIIKEYGFKKLGQNFVPIIDFLPLAEYNKIIQSCSITIMNHYRQQAVGNILTMLWMGSKVYLDNRNSIYHYLKRIGCHIYSIAEASSLNEKLFFESLSSEQIEHNRNTLWKELNTDRLINNLKTFADSFNN
jgi:dTDP-N-acetylfucosamine:lipid II N-acetylfucosaminyltransferase